MAKTRPMSAAAIRELAEKIPGLAEREPHLMPQALQIREALHKLADGAIRRVTLNIEGVDWNITLVR